MVRLLRSTLYGLADGGAPSTMEQMEEALALHECSHSYLMMQQGMQGNYIAAASFSPMAGMFM